MRLKYLLILFIFLQIHLHSLSFQKTTLKIKAFNKIKFFPLDFIHIFDDLNGYRFNHLCKFYTIPKFKRMNSKPFLRILLMLSGEISLNPGPIYLK